MSSHTTYDATNVIDSPLNPICDSETLLRLLSSPLYYNEELSIVNPDAFDLRQLPSGDLEGFVSLCRPSKFTSDSDLDKYLSTMGYKIFDDKPDKGHYYGYGSFIAKDARGINDMVEIHSLKNGLTTHVGLFYRDKDGKYFRGPLPKDDPDILDILDELANILEVQVAPPRNQSK